MKTLAVWTFPLIILQGFCDLEERPRWPEVLYGDIRRADVNILKRREMASLEGHYLIAPRRTVFRNDLEYTDLL